jgi:hypothetical protein
MEIPTVKIVGPGGDYRIINASDFDPETMQLWEESHQEETANDAEPEQTVMVKNPRDRRQRMQIAQSRYDQDPTAWELWE